LDAVSLTTTGALVATPTPTATAAAANTATVTATPTLTPTATSTSTPAGPLPDLVVRSMVIELASGSACNYPSTALGVRVVIENTGSASAGSFDVDVNGAHQQVSGLGAGQTTSLWFSGYNSGVNTAFADALLEVQESDESNNQRTESPAIPT